MIAEAPNAQFNKYVLVRASRPPSAEAMSAYFIARPSGVTKLWTDLIALSAAKSTSPQMIAAANVYLNANDINKDQHYAALADGSLEVVQTIADSARSGDLQSTNDLIKRKYAALFAPNGVGPAVQQLVWDHLAARLISGSKLDGSNDLLRVLRVLHLAEYYVRNKTIDDGRVLEADVVISSELAAFIELAQRDGRQQKRAAELAVAATNLAATVDKVRTTLLARAGKQFLVTAIASKQVAPAAPVPTQTKSDGQNEVVYTRTGKVEFVLDAVALKQLQAMPDLEQFLTSHSPSGALANQDIGILAGHLDGAAAASDSVLLGRLPSAALVRANNELDAAAQVIATGAVTQIQPLAEQLVAQLALGARASALATLDDVSHPNPIQPAGIGDLKIVKQQLQKYALGEVAHIENVMAGETRERVHTLLDRTEQTLILETEEATESEKDLQSTNRFELAQEMESMRKEDKQSEAGINVTASYGAVSMSANAKTSNSQSAEQSLKVSQKNVRETVSRAIERVQKRTRRQQTIVMISERNETNRHSFAASSKSIVGLYRYVDKHYWCQVLNYGNRLMIEFWVPEPAIYYLYSQQAVPRDQGNMIPPEEPNITADDITESNYKLLAARYRAEIPEPPKAFQFSSAINLVPEDQTGGADGGKYTVPDDYEAVSAAASYVFEHITGDNASLMFFIGDDVWDTTAWRSHVYFYPYLRKDFKLRAFGFKTTKWLIGVTLTLRRTDEAYSRWKLAAYNAIISSYRLAKDDFDRRLAEAKLGQQRLSIRNDIEYRSIEKGELKRAALELLTDQHFDGFDAINLNGQVPVIDNPAALVEGPIVRFFEHSFEWENIVYTFYPYFWARKDTWPEKLAAGNTDPVFARFLGAGYSRVVVPVRRGYENHISLYLVTGRLWPDGEAPTMGSPEYLSIIDEIKAADAAISQTRDQEGVAEGSPWQIKLPTNLVCLDTDDVKLPSWEVRPPGKEIPYVPSVATCDGIPYNAAQWPDERSILAEYTLLGFGVPARPAAGYLETDAGRRLTKAFQRRANQVASASVLGRNLKVDGVAGACTLRVLTVVSDIRLKGEWPGPGTP